MTHRPARGVATTRQATRAPFLSTIAALAIIALTPAAARAQSSLELVELEAAFEPATAAPGAETELVVRYSIKKGWYIYAPDHKATGVPTAVTVEAPFLEPDGDLRFPEPRIKRIDVLDETHRILDGEGTLRRRFRIAGDAGTGARSATVRVTVMSCDDTRCLPPAEAELGATLTLAAAVSKSTSGSEAKPKRKPLDLTAGGLGDEPDGTDGDAGDADADTADADPSREKSAKKPGLGDLGIGLPGGLGLKPKTGDPVTWSLELDPPTLRRGARGHIVARYEIESGWHVYSPDHDYHGVGVASAVRVDSGSIRVRGAPTFPEPHVRRHDDGAERTLDGSGAIRFPFVLSREAAPGPLAFTATVDYQACTEISCLPPATTDPIALTLTVSEEEPLAADEVVEEKGAEGDGGDLGLLAFLLLAIGGGIFTLLMPCTYPMIPITISYFTKQAESNRSSVVPMALFYGAGIVFDFILIGVIFGVIIGSSRGLIDFATSWPLNVLLGLLFLLLGLSLVGLYELRLPHFITKYFTGGTARGGYLGVFLLGTTLVVTSFTCTAPFVGATLAAGARGQSAGTIILGMGVFGLTMALPFVGLALFPTAAKKMPKSGEWMGTLKVSLGFLEIAASLKFFSNAEFVTGLFVLPRELFLLIWAMLSGVTGLYLLGMIPLKVEKQPSISPRQLVVGLVVLLFATYCVYGAMGYRLDRIMQAIVPPYSSAGEEVGAAGGGGKKGSKITWTLVKDDWEAGLAKAREEKKLAFINWTGRT